MLELAMAAAHRYLHLSVASQNFQDLRNLHAVLPQRKTGDIRGR